jgi:hypothetical protein
VKSWVGIEDLSVICHQLGHAGVVRPPTLAPGPVLVVVASTSVHRSGSSSREKGSRQADSSSGDCGSNEGDTIFFFSPLLNEEFTRALM